MMYTFRALNLDPPPASWTVFHRAVARHACGCGDRQPSAIVAVTCIRGTGVIAHDSARRVRIRQVTRDPVSRASDANPLVQRLPAMPDPGCARTAATPTWAPAQFQISRDDIYWSRRQSAALSPTACPRPRADHRDQAPSTPQPSPMLLAQFVLRRPAGYPRTVLLPLRPRYHRPETTSARTRSSERARCVGLSRRRCHEDPFQHARSRDPLPGLRKVCTFPKPEPCPSSRSVSSSGCLGRVACLASRGAAQETERGPSGSSSGGSQAIDLLSSGRQEPPTIR